MHDVIIGCYTEKLDHVDGRGPGIAGLRQDACSIEPDVTVLAAARNPSYLALTRSGELLYAVHETDRFQNAEGGGVSAYRRDCGSGTSAASSGSPNAPSTASSAASSTVPGLSPR